MKRIVTPALLVALKHFDDRELTITELRIVLSVSQIIQNRILAGLKLTKDDGATLREIAVMAGLGTFEIQYRLPPLIELRYISEIVLTFGPQSVYRLGAVGGSMLRGVRSAIRKALPDDYIPSTTDI